MALRPEMSHLWIARPVRPWPFKALPPNGRRLALWRSPPDRGRKTLALRLLSGRRRRRRWRGPPIPARPRRHGRQGRARARRSLRTRLRPEGSGRPAPRSLRAAHRSGPPGRTPLYTLGGAAGTVVHGGEDPGGVAANPDLHLLAKASPVAARSFGVGADLAFVHDDWRDALYYLCGHAADAAGEGRRRETVPVFARAHAAAGEEHVGKRLAAFTLTGDLGVPQAVSALGQDFIGNCLCQRAMYHARQEVPDDVPGPDRRGVDGVEDCTFGGGYVDGLEATVIVGYFRADRALHTEGRVRGSIVEHDVDAPLALRRGALVVHDHLVALDPYRDVEPDRLVEPVRVRLVLVHAIGQPFYGLPHGAFGAGADLFRERLDVVEVELLDRLHQPRAAHIVAPRLCVEVPDDLEGRPHVGADEPEEVFVGLAPHEQAGHGHEEPLLVDLARVRAEATPPDVEGVAAVAEVRHHVAAVEDRGDHRKIVEVTRGLPRVVGDQHVALTEGLGGNLAQKVVDGGRHGIYVARRARHRLRDHAAPLVEETRREVARFPDHARERGAHQGPRLLFD